MNTKKLSFTILIIFFSLNIYTQDTNKGDIFSTIFWNYNTDLSSEASKKKIPLKSKEFILDTNLK